MNIRLLAACVVVACIPAATAAPPAWSLDAEYAAWKSLYSISYYATVAEEIERYKVSGAELVETPLSNQPYVRGHE